jgi:hypothetical protein
MSPDPRPVTPRYVPDLWRRHGNNWCGDYEFGAAARMQRTGLARCLLTARHTCPPIQAPSACGERSSARFRQPLLRSPQRPVEVESLDVLQLQKSVGDVGDFDHDRARERALRGPNHGKPDALESLDNMDLI